MGLTTDPICRINSQLKVWKAFCRRVDVEFKMLVDPKICSLHFNSSDIKTSITGRKILVKGAVPSIFDPKATDQEISERSRRNLTRNSNKRKSVSNSHGEGPCAKKTTHEAAVANDTAEVQDHVDFEVRLFKYYPYQSLL